MSTLAQNRQVKIPIRDITLEGVLQIPENAKALVMFVHGSGSSRHSTRNQHVARLLQEDGLATLLFDLLTPEEELIDMRTRQLRFDTILLAKRVIGTTDWLAQQPETRSFPLGYFGASTGAAAALIAAAARPEMARAVVSRGGRPDLAARILSSVRAPTLLIVGGEDTPVINMNKSALKLLETEKKLAIVPGATHLFEEAGALEEVARLASGWFQHYLVRIMTAATQG